MLICQRPGRAVMTAFVSLGLLSILAATAIAAWSASGSGSAAGGALTMPAGNTPTASATGSNITVSWSAATFANGTAVAGYVVQRYDASTGAAATVGASCSGTVTSTTCTEQNVPAGRWTYTDTPVQQSWTGAQSSASSPVSVATAPTAAAPARSLTSPTAPSKAQPQASAALVNPASVSLGSQAVGTTSGAKTVTLTSSGSAPLAVSGVSIEGVNALDFSKRAGGCSGKTLNPGQSCTVHVTFTPSATGSRSARLSFADNAPPSQQTVALSGAGTRVADLGISLSPTPSPVYVSRQLTYTVNVSNRGPDAADRVVVTDALTSGEHFANIAPNGWSCTTRSVSSSRTVTCTRSSIPSGGSSSFTLTVTVDQTGQPTVSDTAHASGQSTDPTTADNTATVTTPVQGGQ